MTDDTKNGDAKQSKIGLTSEKLIRHRARKLIQKAIGMDVVELLAAFRCV